MATKPTAPTNPPTQLPDKTQGEPLAPATQKLMRQNKNACARRVIT